MATLRASSKKKVIKGLTPFTREYTPDTGKVKKTHNLLEFLRKLIPHTNFHYA